jgi:hypothetical protein
MKRIKPRRSEGEKSEAWLKRTAKAFANTRNSRESIIIREPGQNPVVIAFNEALKKERLRNAN